MKLNWGQWLAIAMAIFILFIVGLSIKMMNSSEALYEDDYYEVGENHGDRMIEEEAAKDVTITISVGTNRVYAEFNGLGEIDKIKLIYLANSHFDRIINVQSKKAVESHSVPLGEMKPGLWNVEISGSVNGKAFFNKQKLVI